MIDFIVAIPARFASSRLPGKPLLLIVDDDVDCAPERDHRHERSLRYDTPINGGIDDEARESR